MCCIFSEHLLLRTPLDSWFCIYRIKAFFNAKIKNIEDKITDIFNLATTTALNAEINEVKNKTPNIPKITNIYRIKAYNSIMCWYFYIGVIDFILKGKSLLDYTSLFSPNGYEWWNKTKMFSKIKKIQQLYCVICGKYRTFEKPLRKNISFFIIFRRCKNEDAKLFKEEELVEILKILGLIENMQLL